MRGFVLQDWVTIRAATAVTQVIQNESGWLSLEMYQDAIFWMQASEVTLGGNTPVKMNYETAPIKEETLFSVMGAGGITLTASGQMPTPLVTPVILSSIGAGVPLSRWVRWRLSAAGAAGTWDVTFRILVSCNQLFSTGMGGAPGYGGGGWGQQMR